MTSRLISILRMFPRAQAAVEPRPNSWAELALWRRFFQMKEEEEEELTNMIVDVVGQDSEFCVQEDSHGNKVFVSSAEAVEAREDFLREGYRRLIRGENSNNHNSDDGSNNHHQERVININRRPLTRELDDTDFNIPVGDGSYVTRAQ